MKLTTRIIFASFALALTVLPMRAETPFSADLSAPQTETTAVRFYVTGSNVRVLNAAKLTLQVYSLTGSCVASYKVDSDDKTFTLSLPKGIYIVKVGEVARKIALR